MDKQRTAYATLTLTLGLLLPSLGLAQEKFEGEELFGEWEVVQMVFKGKRQAPEKGKEHIKFERGGISLSYGGARAYAPIKCTFRPGEFDITAEPFAKFDIKAKYEIEGNRLRVIWREEGERPTDFDALKDKGLTLRVLERVAK
ncbi:hypothetical protein [Anatilimnocola floriformis]|uniref:hypothetical protein n=1 Tax=Anatilimnocola floriformis TaxID=2948575 RepID=UPI0020C40721|nr:hypothetical protein [Anatilimnocola floriformis]